MDQRSLGLLEFPAVRARLAAATSFGPSRRLAEALEPSDDPVVVARALDETDQARALLEERPGIGIGAARDIGPAIERAARGGRLEPAQFLEIAETLDATARLATLARRRAPAAPARPRARAPRPAGPALDPGPQLRSGRANCSTRPRPGSVACGPRSGSPTTGCAGGSTRSSAPSSAARSRSRSSPSATGATSCRSRPRRASRVKGIVHDASGSGQTLFIEPLVAVELGNAWREAQVAEAEEVARILDELSAFVAANAAALRETLEALARFDLWAAKASLAADMDATRAETADRPEVVLLSARHPGLSGRVVPIDIRLGDGYTALVVTGPNTGGKTVTLRTLGLLSLMHQAGLHVPAATGSRLPIWRDVFADIGDEQSIAQSLSTFSGHLRSIIRIVEAAGPGHARPARRARRGDRPDRGLGAGAGAARPFHPGRRPRRGDDALRRAQGLRAHDAGRAQRRGRVRPRDAVADLPPDDRAARRQPGVRHRRAARPARSDRRRRPLAAERDASARSRRRSPRSGRPRAPRARRSTGRAPPSCVRPRRSTWRRRSGGGRGASARRPSAPRANEAERIVADLRTEVSTTREALERETVTAPVLDDAVARAEAGLERLPEAEDVPVAEPAVARSWQLGERARSRTGGWEGRIAALERGGRRATLEAGGMRVTVDVDDLVPALGDEAPDRAGNGVGAAGRDLERRGAAPRARAVRRVVTRPARRAGRRGARGADALSRRRQRWPDSTRS